MRGDQKIVGHGIDLVEVAKLRFWLEEPSNPLAPRCFVQEELAEINEAPDRFETFAGRYAAKEAVLKALGTGFGAGVAYSDVVIRRAPGRPPEVLLTGGAARAAENLGITDWQLSISHTEAVAIASAIAIGVRGDECLP